MCLCSPSSETDSSPLKGCEGNCGPGRKLGQPTAGFMTHVTCRLTAKNRDRLRNPTLGNRVTFCLFFITRQVVSGHHVLSATVEAISAERICNGDDVFSIAHREHSALLVQSLLGLWFGHKLSAGRNVVASHLLLRCTRPHQYFLVLQDFSGSSSCLPLAQ